MCKRHLFHWVLQPSLRFGFYTHISSCWYLKICHFLLTHHICQCILFRIRTAPKIGTHTPNSRSLQCDFNLSQISLIMTEKMRGNFILFKDISFGIPNIECPVPAFLRYQMNLLNTNLYFNRYFIQLNLLCYFERILNPDYLL